MVPENGSEPGEDRFETADDAFQSSPAAPSEPRYSIRPGERGPVDELRDDWLSLSEEERLDRFESLSRVDAEEFFLGLSAIDHVFMLERMPVKERRLWMRQLAPDDAADVIQETPYEQRTTLLDLLDAPARREVNALLAYAEDDAGGLMSPRFARLRPEMAVEEAIRYLRRQAEHLETIYYAYVLDGQQRLVGVVSFRQLLASPGDRPLIEVMQPEVIAVPDTMDQEEVAQVVAENDLNAIPVIDSEGRMKGIVTVDDVVDVVHEEATEDMQKVGGMSPFDTPYMNTSIVTLIRKRAGWLAVLFLGEMLTASAMSGFENEILSAVVLALFVPLIISSGGNSGSQASTLIIRAMALGEVTLRDWWRVSRRELITGLALGAILAAIGLVRIAGWEALSGAYGENYVPLAFTVGVSLIGVVTWGTLAGSMLPFIIQRLGFDPASASAPLVATLVDVSGLVIYFSVARIMLSGAMF